jgi:ribose transport system substrate-binding protein
MSNRKWTIALSVLFLVFLYLISDFAYSYIKISDIVGEVADNMKSKTFAKHHIVLISQELDNPFWRTIGHGAEEEAKNFNMDLEYIGPFRLNQSEQMKLLDKTIASKVDGILVQGIETEEYRALIEKAVGRGIPIITVDTDTPGSKRIIYVGTDNVSAGKKLGEVVLKSMQHTSESTKLRIGVIIGSHDAPNQEERLQGFLSIVHLLPNIEVVNVGVSNISRIQATQTAEKMLKDDPQINLMIGTSALDAVGILQAVKSLQRLDSVKIFGFDDLEETKVAISKGEIEATIIQKPEEMGREAIKELHAYFEGRAAQEGLHLTSYEVLDRSNIVEAMSHEH